MAGESVFKVTTPRAPMLAVDPEIAGIAEQLARAAAAGTPVDTGTLAGGYHVVRLRASVYAVRNDVAYWRFVEFGTIHDEPNPAMGRALAEARARLGSL